MTFLPSLFILACAYPIFFLFLLVTFRSAKNQPFDKKYVRKKNKVPFCFLAPGAKNPSYDITL